MSIFNKTNDLVVKDVIVQFMDDFYNFSKAYESLLLDLNQRLTFRNSMDELFRKVHSIKAVAGFLGAYDIEKLFALMEEALYFLKNGDYPIDTKIYTWFKDIIPYLKEWNDEMEDGAQNLSPLSQDIFNFININQKIVHKPDITLKKLSLLFISNNPQSLEILSKYFRIKMGRLHAAKNEKIGLDIFYNNSIDIIVLDINEQTEDSFYFIKQIRNISKTKPIIVLQSDPNKAKTKLDLLGICALVEKPLKINLLENALNQIVYINFAEKGIKIFEQEVRKEIDSLEPMDVNTTRILSICNSERTSIKDVANAVKKDPIFCTKILKNISKPLFGGVKTTDIDLAVSHFGKNMIMAFLFEGTLGSLATKNLMVYGITEAQFLEIAQNRLMFMQKFYSKIDYQKLKYLLTSAILGNIAQPILANLMVKNFKANYFKSLLDSGFEVEAAELTVLRATTQEISSDIICSYKIDSIISSSIRFSSDLSAAQKNTDSQLVQLARANRAVFKLFDLCGNIHFNKAKEIADEVFDGYENEKQPFLKSVEELI